MASVYALTDPDTGLVRYVGATTTEVGRRIGRLRSSATRRGDRYPVCAWLRELGDRRPDHVVLEMCHRLDLATAERFWIEFMRSQGLADLNGADNVGNPGMLLYNATTSVERILGIRAYGRGGCRAWVLDLVEAGVEQLERDRVLVGGA